MKYISVDKLCDFEFHDSKITFDSYVNNQLILNAVYLNVHKDAVQNLYDTDMEISTARITFNDFRTISYEPDRTWKQIRSGVFSPDESPVFLSGDDAMSRFLVQLKAGVTVYDIGIKEAEMYYLDAISEDPFL